MHLKRPAPAVLEIYFGASYGRGRFSLAVQ
jgi:hypothetical protein